MSLPIPNLDDRTFQQLVDEAKQLIPTYCPEWTNHNLSDPGVALIELFAHMTEVALYRLNQVPDKFYTHMLNLLGIEPYATSAAKVDILFWMSGEQVEPVMIPAETEVATSGEYGERQIFMTLMPALVRKSKIIDAFAQRGRGKATWSWKGKLESGVEVECFPEQPVQPDDCFYLGFEESLARNAVRLEIDAEPQGIGVDPSNPPLVWEAWDGAGWIPASVPAPPGRAELADSTGGLNRQGNVLLLVRSKHEKSSMPRPTDEESPVEGSTAYWVRARVTAVKDGQKPYARSPRISRVTPYAAGGIVEAEHSELVAHRELGASSGKPGQVFELGTQPILPRRSGEHIEVLEPGQSEWKKWEEVDSFIDSDKDSRHVRWDSSTGEIMFGPQIRNLVEHSDGIRAAVLVQYGAIPPKMSRVRVSRFRTGGGEAGNVPAGALRDLRGAVKTVTSVENLFPARGGVDAETPANAKLRGPQTVRAGDRAVTAADYERLTPMADPRIAKVRCLPPERTREPIRLLVVPRVTLSTSAPDPVTARRRPAGSSLRSTSIDDFALSEDLHSAIKIYLDDRRILGTEIEVTTPYYVGVSVAAEITADPDVAPSTLELRVMSWLDSFLHPLSGGLGGRGWDFGIELTAQGLREPMRSIEGVQRVGEVVLFEYDLRNRERQGVGRVSLALPPRSLFLAADHKVVVR